MYVLLEKVTRYAPIATHTCAHIFAPANDIKQHKNAKLCLTSFGLSAFKRFTDTWYALSGEQAAL